MAGSMQELGERAYVAMDERGRPFAVFDDEPTAREHVEDVGRAEDIDLPGASVISLPRYSQACPPRGQWLWTLSGRVVPEGDGHKVMTDQRRWGRMHWDYEPKGLWQLNGCDVETGVPGARFAWLQVIGPHPETVQSRFAEEAERLAKRMKTLRRAS